MQLRKRVKEIEKLKEEGNTFFKSGALRDAVEKYTAAIEVPCFLMDEKLQHYLTDS